MQTAFSGDPNTQGGWTAIGLRVKGLTPQTSWVAAAAQLAPPKVSVHPVLGDMSKLPPGSPRSLPAQRRSPPQWSWINAGNSAKNWAKAGEIFVGAAGCVIGAGINGVAGGLAGGAATGGAGAVPGAIVGAKVGCVSGTAIGSAAGTVGGGSVGFVLGGYGLPGSDWFEH